MLRRVFDNRPGPYVIGHRGAAGYAPENTMVSFERAIALRADAIELDIHPSADDELVVIHDPTLNRTTSGSGLVSTHTLAQLSELDAGSWFHSSFASARIPSLREVLGWARGRVKVVIEIKQGPIFYEQVPRLLVKLLEETGMRRDVLVISFDHFSVRQVKQLDPEVATGVLYAARPINPATLARDALADVLLPHWSELAPEDVETAHQAGLVVAPWGGPEQDYRILLALGVDAVAADFPDRPRLLMDA